MPVNTLENWCVCIYIHIYENESPHKSPKYAFLQCFWKKASKLELRGSRKDIPLFWNDFLSKLLNLGKNSWLDSSILKRAPFKVPRSCKKFPAGFLYFERNSFQGSFILIRIPSWIPLFWKEPLARFPELKKAPCARIPGNWSRKASSQISFSKKGHLEHLF